MPLLPDKPNPKVRSFAQPDETTRRCTRCCQRKPHDDFRWLWQNIRKASRCKDCERSDRRAKRSTDGKVLTGRFSLGNLSKPRARILVPDHWTNPPSS